MFLFSSVMIIEVVAFYIERLRTHESFASNKTIIEGQFFDKNIK